jgi:predicted dehydrogenase
VRGNWRSSAESSFMLMAKSCHDLDWLQYVLGEPPTRVSSFGRLSHFRPENKPTGAADRCLDCGVESDCPYSAKRLYFDALVQGHHRFPLSALVEEYTPEALGDALRNGPYGRCVYACDNDVVDHQVVSMEFGSGATSTFTMTAFNEAAHRKTQLFGTRGEINGDGELIRVYDFLSRTERVVEPGTFGDMTAGGGHGGGDAGLMDAFTAAVAAGDPDLILSGPLESLTSHLSVFAAEQARLRGTVEQIRPPLELLPSGA